MGNPEILAKNQLGYFPQYPYLYFMCISCKILLYVFKGAVKHKS